MGAWSAKGHVQCETICTIEGMDHTRRIITGESEQPVPIWAHSLTPILFIDARSNTPRRIRSIL